MNTLVFVIGSIIFVLAVMEHPYYFRYRSLRFVYRSGLLLYFRAFKIRGQTNKFNIPRWKIEHWMVASGFSSGLSSPMAEEDGEGRYIFTEFAYPLFAPVPLLMRGKVSWDNQEKNVIVRGYATWTSFLFFALLVAGLFIPSKVEGNMCGGIALFIYLLLCAMVYLYQMSHLYSIGEKISDYLSREEE